MPTYDYRCDVCGPFTALRPMAQFRDPGDCPTCGASVPRASPGAPAIVSLIPGRHGGHTGTAPRQALAAHPAGCGCCARAAPLPGGVFAREGRVFTAHGPTRRSGR